MTINIPHRDSPIVKSSGLPSDEFRGWMEEVTRQVELQTVLEGSGSPEGVVVASVHKPYFDVVNLKYYRKTIDGTSVGWLALN